MILRPSFTALVAFIVSPGTVFGWVIVACVGPVLESHIVRVPITHSPFYTFMVVWASVLEIADLFLGPLDLALLALNLL